MAEFAVMPIEDYRRACDAIREKTETTDPIKSGDMGALIRGIEGGGGGTQLPELTTPGAAAQLVEGYQLIDQDGNIVDGAMPVVELDTPFINVDETGKITATVEQAEGYVEGGTKEATKNLLTQGAKTITPSKNQQTAVEKYRYTTDEIKVAPIPDNYQDVSGVTATPSDVLRGKKIQTVGGELDGTMPNNGKTSGTLDGLTITRVEIPEGYTEGGEITFDDTALAARIDAI